MSALLHLLLFATISFDVTFDAASRRRPLRTFRVAPAMQVYEIEPVTVGIGDPEPEPLPPRQELPVPVYDGPVPVAPVTSGVLPAPSAPAAASAADRLRRGYTDPQLLRPVERLPPEELSEAELLRLRLAYRLGLYNDSLAAAAEAAARATDWTVTDRNGGKWGVSPGRIHLGDHSIPLPFGFAPPPGRREEIAGQVRSWNESQAQAARADAAETFEQRVKAIRARQQAARDSAKKAGGD